MKAFDYEPIFNKTTLSNGVRVLTEHHPYSRAVSAGLYIQLGTRDEPKDIIGAAHFVEHLVFKGTKSRTAMDIAKSLEAVGGELNAYTTQEFTCLHATSLREHLPLSLDVLTDLVTNALFDKKDFENEREVILQEIDMSSDLLEDYIFDLYFEHAFKTHPLGRPILGTKKSLAHITRKKLYDFYRSRYFGKNMVIAVAGHVNHKDVVELVEKAFRWNKRPKKVISRRVKPKIKPFNDVLIKPSEQSHLLVGLPSATYCDSYRFESYIVNAYLGGGMTSRLYQIIREKRALAYTVYSYLHTLSDSGVLMIYAGTSEQHFKKVLDIIYREMENLLEKGLSKRALNFFKTQVEGSMLLNADDIENRMNSLGINEMIFGRYRPVDEVINEIQGISCESVQKYLKKYFKLSQLSKFIIGDVNKEKTTDLLNQY